MTKQEAIKTMKTWLTNIDKVPTNISNKTDLTTGKKLTPVQISKYYAVAKFTPVLTREDITKILDNGFPAEPKPTPKKAAKPVAKKAAKPVAKKAAKTKTMIQIIDNDGSTYNRPYTKKWIAMMNDEKMNKLYGRTYKIIEVKESDYKVFTFSNGMTVTYKGDRKGINAACIAVRDGKIVAKAFSTKGQEGMVKSAQRNYTLNHKKGREGKLFFSK